MQGIRGDLRSFANRARLIETVIKAMLPARDFVVKRVSPIA